MLNNLPKRKHYTDSVAISFLYHIADATESGIHNIYTMHHPL